MTLFLEHSLVHRRDHHDGQECRLQPETRAAHAHAQELAAAAAGAPIGATSCSDVQVQTSLTRT